ncbi:hypothetical protein KKE78_01230 [Patescibacteria group bacterium]|nr:hypothetical protein [Patescibacteria group bacterium]
MEEVVQKIEKNIATIKDSLKADDWRKVMLTQHSVFGTIAGLEVTALAILTSITSNGLGSNEEFLGH